MKGVSEDVVEIFLNLKQVRFKKNVDHEVANEKIILSLKNKTEFTASMIGEGTHSFQIMNRIC
jgi:DNA-directed RNA polymerase subunit alpha